jgi:hypothetical protein
MALKNCILNVTVGRKEGFINGVIKFRVYGLLYDLINLLSAVCFWCGIFCSGVVMRTNYEELLQIIFR